MKEERYGLGIPYSIRDVCFGGKGIFSTQKVKAGTLVWRYAAGENVVEYDGEAAITHLESLTLDGAKRFLDTTYGLGDKLCYITDDGKYMNHSTEPNCWTDMKTGNTYAIRDINPEEQLFEDYGTFEHPSFLLPLLAKYDCAPDYYEIPSIKQ